MQRSMLWVGMLMCCALAVAATRWAGVGHADEPKAPSRLCVVWSSGDLDVAKNVCLMYTHNAKRRGWFDEVHLLLWGPSDKLLAENKELQAELQDMQKSGVIVEACVTCAKRYGVVDALKGMGVDVKPMGEPLSNRLKDGWKVLSF